MALESSLSVNIKAIYVAVFGICALMYAFVKNKLTKKLESEKLAKCYCYLYLAVIVFVSRLVMAYIFKENEIAMLDPSFSKLGVGSYINYGLAKIINNQMYANVIINTLIAFISCILVKEIILKITVNDTLASITSIMYILLPQSLVYVNEYVRSYYNVLIVLSGMLMFINILDEVKNFNKKNNRYLIYSVILGVIASLDIVFGGSYVLWASVIIITSIVSMYVDMIHINIKFKNKLDYKLKILSERIERINISKLILVSLISLIIPMIVTIIYAASNANNYMMNITNVEQILLHSRNYYLVLIICSAVFEVLGLILRRKLDNKIFMVKVAMISSIVLLAFTVNNIYVSAVFDTLLILTVITNVCNICYNREEKVKLLKDKN